MINDLARGRKNCESVKKYGLSKSTLTTLAKGKEILAAASQSGNKKRRRLHKAAFKDAEDVVLKWLLDARARDLPINWPLLKAQEEKFVFLLDSPDGWLHHFKACHSVVSNAFIRQAISVTAANVDHWLEENVAIMHQYPAWDIYDADETVLFFQMLPWTIPVAKGDKCTVGRTECKSIDEVWAVWWMAGVV